MRYTFQTGAIPWSVLIVAHQLIVADAGGRFSVMSVASLIVVRGHRDYVTSQDAQGTSASAVRFHPAQSDSPRGMRASEQRYARSTSWDLTLCLIDY